VRWLENHTPDVLLVLALPVAALADRVSAFGASVAPLVIASRR
jgi:hypothetical protein